MLLNLSLLYILLKNWSTIPSQNKRRILAHGCLPPVKNCKHKNKHFITDDDNIPSPFCEISIITIAKKAIKGSNNKKWDLYFPS